MNFIPLAGLILFLSAKLQNKNRDYWTSSLLNDLHLTCQSSWFPLKAFAGFVSLDLRSFRPGSPVHNQISKRSVKTAIGVPILCKY